MAVMGPKRGDLEPPLVLNVSDDANHADLNTVSAGTWRVIGRLRDATVDLFNIAPVLVVVDPVSPWKAVVTHQWLTAHTLVAGTLLVEVEVTWPSGRKQTFPNAGYQSVVIDSDLS